MRFNIFKKEYLFIICLLNFIILMQSCKEDIANTPPTSTSGNFEKPPFLNDGWEVDYMASVGINDSCIIYMLNYLNNNNHRIHSILIIKNSKLVFEKYFGGYRYLGTQAGLEGEYITYGYDTLHYLASVSKSITSTVFSIAVDKGFFSNLDDKLINQLPQYSSILTGNKEYINLKHLLTMTSGLSWDETTYPYGDPRNDVTALFYQSDPIRFILSKSLITNPGSTFAYSSGSPNVISHLVSLKTGMNFINFTEQNLFSPLGITKYKWERLNGQYCFASGGLWLTPRSIAKIGYLYLNHGNWKGINIISDNMINHSFTKHINVPWLGSSGGYGYYWWLNSTSINGHTYDYANAAGWGEQFMFIVPSENMLVLFNGGYFTVPVSVSPLTLFNDYILKSIN